MSEKAPTGYPSIDKPWLKYCSKEDVSAPLPECTMYELLYANNREHLDDIALNHYGRKITYDTLFKNIELAAKAFSALGVRAGEVVIICSVNTPETVYAFYALNRLDVIANMVDPRTNAAGVHEYITECNVRFVVTVEAAYPLIVRAGEKMGLRKIISLSPADSLPQPMKSLYRLKNKPHKLKDDVLTWTQFITLGNNIVWSLDLHVLFYCCVGIWFSSSQSVTSCASSLPPE